MSDKPRSHTEQIVAMAMAAGEAGVTMPEVAAMLGTTYDTANGRCSAILARGQFVRTSRKRGRRVVYVYDPAGRPAAAKTAAQPNRRVKSWQRATPDPVIRAADDVPAEVQRCADRLRRDFMVYPLKGGRWRIEHYVVDEASMMAVAMGHVRLREVVGV
jgi:hypothetical protein